MKSGFIDTYLQTISQLNNYDHHAAIYLLLLERLRTRSISQDSTNCIVQSGTKHPSLESQRRRPSSVAEQAMRKLGISSNSSHSRTLATGDTPVSPRHHNSSISTVNTIDSTPHSSVQTLIGPSPMPSMMTLRDTNIREQPQQFQKEMGSISSGVYMRGSSNYMMNTTGLNMATFLSRERDCASPYSSSGHQSLGPLGCRENSAIIARSECNGTPPINYPYRIPSSRLLASGIDQRILKQSTEDCRRLLQQATAVADSGRHLNSVNVLEVVHQQPQQQQLQQLQLTPTPPPSHRVLTSSNSFDSKSNLPQYGASGFQMSLEATRLFNTLQQSPLPLPGGDTPPMQGPNVRQAGGNDSFRYYSQTNQTHPFSQACEPQRLSITENCLGNDRRAGEKPPNHYGYVPNSICPSEDMLCCFFLQ